MSPNISTQGFAGRFALGTLLLAAAVLTGCSADSGASAKKTLPNLFGLKTVSDEPVNSLNANLPAPPDSRHRLHSREASQLSLSRFNPRSL